MRIFITGSAGFIGRATIRELVKNGHQVLGLARSEASAEKVINAGAEAHIGRIEDIDSLRSSVKAVDGVVHLAFTNDFQDFPRATAADRAAIEAMAEVLAGTGKPLIIASGTLAKRKGVLATEDAEDDRDTPLAERIKSADLLFALAKEKQFRGILVQFSPTVHGAGDAGLIPMLINTYRQKDSVVYVNDGSARWPAVHREDAAALIRLALEKGTAGATYNAVAEQGVPMKDIMTVIGKHLNLPVEGKSPEEATEKIGFLAYLIGLDNPTSSEKTQSELGWHPTQPGLLADMEANYFS